MLETHFKIKMLTTGYQNWTLPTRLGHMLYEAETKYGQRDNTYSLLGVEFDLDANKPYIWYQSGAKYLVIRLTSHAIDDEMIAFYQLAHECIHALAPLDPNLAIPDNVIEEGLATVFSENYMLQNFNKPCMTHEQKYIDAAAEVRKLLAVNDDAIGLLRAKQPCYKRLVSNDFTTAFPGIDAGLVQALLSPF